MYKALAACLLILQSGLLFGLDDIIGEIVFMQGDVRIIRNNSELDFIDFGEQIENFDQIITGPDGSIEIAVYPETGIHASIIVAADTSMYFDLTSLRGEQNGAVELLTGQLELTIARLQGNNQFNIRTNSALLGVRGTEFSVNATLAGDILLAATDGRVECRTASNEVLFAVPGEIVEKVAEGRWRNLSVESEGLGDFRSRWISERRQFLQDRAAELMIEAAGMYLAQREEFIQSYVRLMSNRTVIQKWIEEDRLGIIGSVADRVRERRQIQAPLVNARSRLFPFERVYTRVQQLMGRFPNLSGNTEISPGLSYRNFVRQFNQDSRSIEQRMQEIRYIIKMYSLRNEGQSPFDGFEGPFSGAPGAFGNAR